MPSSYLEAPLSTLRQNYVSAQSCSPHKAKKEKNKNLAMGDMFSVELVYVSISYSLYYLYQYLINYLLDYLLLCFILPPHYLLYNYQLDPCPDLHEDYDTIKAGACIYIRGEIQCRASVHSKASVEEGLKVILIKIQYCFCTF